MGKATTEALAARVDVLSVVMQEVARMLTPQQAGVVTDAILARVAEQAVAPLSPAVDEAISAELAQLLSVLRAV